jgi:hypothetical protein
MEDSSSSVSWWGTVKRAQGTLTKLSRRRVHHQNVFGDVLRGTATEEERLAAALEQGVAWLSREPTAGSRVGFTDGYGVKCYIQERSASNFARVRTAFGVSDIEYCSVLARGATPKGFSPDKRATFGEACDSMVIPARVDSEQRRPRLSKTSSSQKSSMRVLGLSDAAGKSLSWFLVTQGCEYVIKTCDPTEVTALLALLPRYAAYMEAFAADSLLPRYYNLYVLERGDMNITLVVMTNVFAGHHRIVRRFDVKGATYGCVASEAERAKGQTATFKDLDLLALGQPMVVKHSQAILTDY